VVRALLPRFLWRRRNPVGVPDNIAQTSATPEGQPPWLNHRKKAPRTSSCSRRGLSAGPRPRRSQKAVGMCCGQQTRNKTSFPASSLLISITSVSIRSPHMVSLQHVDDPQPPAPDVPGTPPLPKGGVKARWFLQSEGVFPQPCYAEAVPIQTKYHLTPSKKTEKSQLPDPGHCCWHKVVAWGIHGLEPGKRKKRLTKRISKTTRPIGLTPGSCAVHS